MLRITTANDGFECVLKLEGKLLADWVGELRETCQQAQAAFGDLQLDLSGLSFVDPQGTLALRELMRQGIRVTTTSPFIGELLKEIDS